MVPDVSRIAVKPWWQKPIERPHEPRSTIKGAHGGPCGRIACENEPSYWFNATNGKYYCGVCAKRFNDVSQRHGEQPLCELRL